MQIFGQLFKYIWRAGRCQNKWRTFPYTAPFPLKTAVISVLDQLNWILQSLPHQIACRWIQFKYLYCTFLRFIYQVLSRRSSHYYATRRLIIILSFLCGSQKAPRHAHSHFFGCDLCFTGQCTILSWNSVTHATTNAKKKKKALGFHYFLKVPGGAHFLGCGSWILKKGKSAKGANLSAVWVVFFLFKLKSSSGFYLCFPAFLFWNCRNLHSGFQ